MGAFGAGPEFGGVVEVVLVTLNAELAGAVAWLAAIHSKAAGVVFFRAGGDVLAGHETVAINDVIGGIPEVDLYSPTGVF